ncbi:MAG: peptidylprolyl isomerase [Rectinemataceae bacterium]
MNIAKNRVVTLDYSLRDAAGKLIDSSEGSEPLVYLHGNENIIPGLEKHLEGKIAGDKISCIVPAVEGYGERDEQLIVKIDRKDFGPDAEIAPGMQFEAHGEEGVQIVTVVSVDGSEVTIDANHPLAGENLHFDVKVVDVREASEEELKHGHVHSGSGCSDDCDECGDECGCGCGGEDDACEDGCSCGDGGSAD